MITAFIVTGELIDHLTIKLKEPIPLENGEIKIVIEPRLKMTYSRKNLLGSLKGKIIIHDDFNEPWECFKEYIK